jgi:hypothetical protein
MEHKRTDHLHDAKKFSSIYGLRLTCIQVTDPVLCCRKSVQPEMYSLNNATTSDVTISPTEGRHRSQYFRKLYVVENQTAADTHQLEVASSSIA